MDGVNSFCCLCNAGFSRDLCNINIDDCVDISCTGHGECVEGVNFFDSPVIVMQGLLKKSVKLIPMIVLA